MMRQNPVSVHLPTEYIQRLDRLVEAGMYPNRNEAIRTAIQDLLKAETPWGVEVSDRLLQQVARRRT